METPDSLWTVNYLSLFNISGVKQDFKLAAMLFASPTVAGFQDN